MEKTNEGSNNDAIVNGKPEGAGPGDAFGEMFDQPDNHGNESPRDKQDF
jgi:hypothetical protein